MPIVLFFSSHQISGHPIRNFRSNQSTRGVCVCGGGVDKIETVKIAKTICTMAWFYLASYIAFMFV